VVVNHVWPSGLTGGYAGVDVFFVISGFLITTHLMSEPPRSVMDLGRFWARRIRRLLPAALLTLIVAVAGTWLFAPQTLWVNTARMSRAAATYWINWLLAHDAVDYFAADNPATPVQHFWSLSVEEQFYALWPILIALAGLAVWLLTRRANTPRQGQSLRRVVFAVLVVLAGVSLAYSIHDTKTNPAGAYFVTTTRAWELAAGGLLAVAMLGRNRLLPAGSRWVLARNLTAWVGLACIGVTFVAYTGSTPFPGWTALLPVVGALLVIAANPVANGSEPGQLLALKPVQWLGDVSYSLYLWHWPILLLEPYALAKLHLGHEGTGVREKIAILVLALVVAGLSKRFVEDPARRWKPTLKLRWVFPAAVVGMAVVVAFTSTQIRTVNHRIDAQLVASTRDHGPCFGAEALTAGNTCPAPSYDDLVLDPATAANDDFNHFYATLQGCDHKTNPAIQYVVVCQFGSSSHVDVEFVGNSHMDQWSSALITLAKARHWTIKRLTWSGCVLGYDKPLLKHLGCAESNKAAMAQIAKDEPRLLIASFLPYTVSTVPMATRVLKQWAAQGRKVVVVRDTPTPVGVWGTPQPQGDIPRCLESHADDMSKCVTQLQPDPWATAAQELDDQDTKVIDMTRWFDCAKTCPSVIGNVIVYFDNSHISSTYAASLTPELNAAIQKTGLAPQ